MSQSLKQQAEEAKAAILRAAKLRESNKRSIGERQAAQVLEKFKKSGYPSILWNTELQKDALDLLKSLGISYTFRGPNDCHCAMLNDCEFCRYPYKYEYKLKIDDLTKK